MITVMEVVAYIFFISLLLGSFLIGAWLSRAENKRLKNKGL
jgi:Kef-type K+ transport system membrane component KefB